MEGLITVKYRVAASTVAGAGKGLFLEEPVAAGKILIAPTKVTHTLRISEVLAPEPPPHVDTSVIWFEDHCVVSPGYPDDFFINHSFTPNVIWHLGFVFALRDIASHEELFVDYRHLIAPGIALDFRDGATGREIVGYAWKDSLRITAQQVLDLSNRL